MHEIDVNQLLTSIISGAAVWATIRAEIKFLWKTSERHEKRLDEQGAEIVELKAKIN